MWIKRSFVWLKKIALDEYFYEIVFFSHVVAFCSCGGLGKFFVWFEVFFIFSTTRLDSMKYNHSFFPRCCERGSWLCAGKIRIYIHFFGFFISKAWQKKWDKKLFFNRYHIIIFGYLCVQFYVPSGIKNFQKKNHKSQECEIR